MVTPSTWDRCVNALCTWACRTWPDRHRVVPKADDPDVALLDQFAIVKGRLYLQRFRCPETSTRYHVHRWHYMRSLVLSASYQEARPWLSFYNPGALLLHTRGTTFSMDRSVIHHVTWWHPLCWTLFYMSAERDDAWGYYDVRADGSLGPLIPWREAIVRRVASLETGRVTP